MSNIFVDANVILDLFEENRPYHQYSFELMNKYIIDDSITLYISSDMISNIFYILNSRYKYGFQNTVNIIEKISQTYTIHSVTKLDIENSINICKDNTFKDYEDALQYICAVGEDCKTIITNNPKDFKNSTIEILTSKQAVKNDI